MRVVEYFNATLSHYFITPITGEISALGKPPFQAWQPTGQSFSAYAPAVRRRAPSGCAVFQRHFLGVSTHFYAPDGWDAS